MKFFPEEAHSISLHPSGLHVLVGFSDKLRLMNLLMDDMQSFHEFHIRGCREVQFSTGGHLFAAVAGNVIQIYSTSVNLAAPGEGNPPVSMAHSPPTISCVSSFLSPFRYTFENVGSLKGHHVKVQSVAWNKEDTQLASCGVDGAVYTWDLVKYRRISENVIKSCGYTSGKTISPLEELFCWLFRGSPPPQLVLTTGGLLCLFLLVALGAEDDYIYAVGSDKTLKVFKGSQLHLEIPAAAEGDSDVILTHVMAGASGQSLFATTSTGVVRSLNFPLTSPGEWQDVAIHDGAVNKMCLTAGGQFLVTVGRDGCIFVHSITESEGRSAKRDRDLEYVWCGARSAAGTVQLRVLTLVFCSCSFSEEILITKSDLEEKNSELAEFKIKLEELKMANEYQLRLKDMNFNDKMKELTEKFMQEIEAVKSQLQAARADKVRLREESRSSETRRGFSHPPVPTQYGYITTRTKKISVTMKK